MTKVSTKQKLASSFLNIKHTKNVNEIHIKDITLHAGVTYPTFFNNFNSENDLINYIFLKADTPIYELCDELTKKLGSSQLSKNGLEEAMQQIANKMYENQEILSVLYSKRLYGLWKNFLLQRYEPLTYKHLFSTRSLVKPGINTATANKVFVRTIVTTLQIWLTKSVPEYPDTLRDDMVKILFNPYEIK